ncbi:GNAT family N-acetyltransferase [Candidatus Hodarchaeum mangrovi]
MLRNLFTSLFKNSESKLDLKFLENIQTEPLSQTCYVIWYYFEKSKNIQLKYLNEPFRYIFRFDNKYHISGTDIWEMESQIKWFKTNIVIQFNDKDLWDDIRAKFTNFRSLETNKNVDIFNTYFTYFLSNDRFKKSKQNYNSVVQIPNKTIYLPKRYRHLKGGLAYGYMKDKEIISFAAAPHILIKVPFSYAIIRGIETRLVERRQGFAYETMSKLCEALFNEVKINCIYLWVEENNLAAIYLYEKLGFLKDSVIYATYCDLRF